MSDVAGPSSRPRRSTRAPAKFTQPEALTRPALEKKKPIPIDPAEQLKSLLTNPKSDLTTIDISTILNASTWGVLSPEARESLCALLPPTAFANFQPSVDPSHPSQLPQADKMEVDGDESQTRDASLPLAELFDPSTFTDAHFLAAAHTFQDHIFSGWMTDAHKEAVTKYEQGVRDGSLHAAWKDEVWKREHLPPIPVVTSGQPGQSSQSTPESSARAGEAAGLKLSDLVKNSILLVGDVLAYKRNFPQLDITVEKDVIIESIHPKNQSLSVLIEPGTTTSLPPEVLIAFSGEPTGDTKRMTFTSPTNLENSILDIDGRVEKARRPNGNAWKAVTVHRWRQAPSPDDDLQLLACQQRGGRESHGTLFYLRGCYYHER